MIYEWRYVHGGRVKHSVCAERKHASAVCGVGPWWFDNWRGTGSQDEYERVAQLPVCKRCAKIGPLPEEKK